MSRQTSPVLQWLWRSWARLCLVAGAVLIILASPKAQQSGVLEPTDTVIRYFENSDLKDPLTKLEKELEMGRTSLAYDSARGYLPALLERLSIPFESQTLVFSKTSNQSPHVSPQRPRAIYFNNEAYVGWAQGDRVIDVISVDPIKGPLFFTVSQEPGGRPRIRRSESCMNCHIGSKTLNVPGIMLRSVYTDAAGKPTAQVSGFVSGHNNPLKDRWGGWYVTGLHLGDVHLGNAPGKPERDEASMKRSSNVTSLGTFFDVSKYLVPTSDTVALLVLDHASRMQNMITLAQYETLYSRLDRPTNPSYADQRLHRAGEQLLAYMLFRDEAPLHGQVVAVSKFKDNFVRSQLRDQKGRGLREFDLKGRLFRYPCSYMIYSRAFDALPPEMKSFLWSRLDQVLTGKERSGLYATMSDVDRKAVREILIETKPDFKRWLDRHRP